jgi:surface polysaccharide O-acyltransferase-like enzyme
MVTLFLLAGMSICYSLHKRSPNIFLKERVVKLLLPLITGSLLLNPIMTYIWALNQHRSESFPDHYIGFFTKPLGSFDGLAGGYTPGHLWFVLYLLVFSVAGLPLFLWLNSERSTRIRHVLADFFQRPLALLLLTIPYVLLYFIELLDEKNPIAYFYIVLVGALFATDERYFAALRRDKWVYTGLSLVLYLIFFYCWSAKSTGLASSYGFAFVVKALKIIPAFFALIGIFRSYISRDSRVLKYLSGASFCIYVTHMVTITVIGFFVIRLPVDPVVKLLIIIISGYTICFALYELMRRTKRLGLLFGASYKPFLSKVIPSSEIGKTRYIQ